MGAPAASPARPLRVIHFVTGGFSGATQVALDLVRAALDGGTQAPLLALRRKRQTPLARVAQLQREGVPVRLVPGWSHAATVWSLARLCRELEPDVLVCHGFSDHLWGRYAGLLAGVPVLVHVEHNSRERYTRWRLAQAHWLARRTAAIVGCSEGVRRQLLALGFPAERTLAISNGIRTAPFADAELHPYAARTPGIVMAARFARQKDHPTLLRALALLRQRGLCPPLLLAGQGSRRHLQTAQALAQELGVQDQVRFLGHCPDVPGLLMSHQICVLSSHYEGMPLSLVEGMAAGCAVVGSAVPGIQELIEDGVTGRLVAHADAPALADALEQLLRDPAAAAALARRAREEVMHRYRLEDMTGAYERLLLSLRPAAPTR
ncbi:glycosyltransferase [Azohydromonas sp. G-1-1-14]|uniref:Glycosyltransferase n=2 Tax=Azohydromonas caseinilytica TaxID=2728836 RepID=A0A848F7E1_9BURK|nr:glycosyltransferase [Azohydromonas caseinilytica]